MGSVASSGEFLIVVILLLYLDPNLPFFHSSIFPLTPIFPHDGAGWGVGRQTPGSSVTFAIYFIAVYARFTWAGG